MSKPYFRSFAAGEIAEELYGRIDLAKRQTGLALCKNFWVLPHGPAQNCPGSKYVLDVKDSTNKVRLRGFAFSDTQTMVLEFGAGWLRFHTAGGTVLEPQRNIAVITQANPGVLTTTFVHGYSNGQTVFLDNAIAGMVQLRGRFVKVNNVTGTTFELQDLNGVNINTTAYTPYSFPGGKTARVYEIASPYAAADIFDLHFTQKADVMTIVHPNYPPKELKRLGAINWTLTDISFNPTSVAPNFAACAASPASGTSTARYKVTTVTPGGDESLPSFAAIGSLGGTILGVTQANPGVFNIAAHGLAVNGGVVITGATGMPQINGEWIVNTVPDANHITLLDANGTPMDTTAFPAYTASSGAASNTDIANDLTVAGNKNTITWNNKIGAGGSVNVTAEDDGLLRRVTSVTIVAGGTTYPASATWSYFGAYGKLLVDAVGKIVGSTIDSSASIGAAGTFAATINQPAIAGLATATRYNIYKLRNGLYGFIGQGSATKFVDDNITPDLGRSLLVPNNVFLAANDYPGAVGYYEGRRVFAGTNNAPLLLVATKSGTESNTSYSIPSRDDDTIQLSILSEQAARIRHIVPLDVLVLLTALGVWKVAPVNSDILTPSTSKPKLLSGGGANNVQPILSGASVLFPAAQGGRIRELKYRADANFIAAYVAADISVMAPHLFDGFTIIDAAYSETPNRMAFFVRSDGVLIGLTYLPEHDVVAWWQRTTDGLFESVAAVLEGNETVLYAVVNHQGVRRVEVMSTRRFATLADCYFMDSGVSYIGAPITTISNGLWHLEGKTVSILADGAVHAQKVVTNGSVTLDQPASKVHIGLPIVADLQTMPCAIEGAPAAGQANVKSVNEAWIRVKDTSNLKVGPDFVNMRVLKQRTNEPYGSPPALMSGVEQISISGKWAEDGSICIRQDQPLPITISALALGVRDGG